MPSSVFCDRSRQDTVTNINILFLTCALLHAFTTLTLARSLAHPSAVILHTRGHASSLPSLLSAQAILRNGAACRVEIMMEMDEWLRNWHKNASKPSCPSQIML